MLSDRKGSARSLFLHMRNRTRDFPVSRPPGHRAKLIKYNFPIQFQHSSVEWPSQDAHQDESTWETERKKKAVWGEEEKLERRTPAAPLKQVDGLCLPGNTAD